MSKLINFVSPEVAKRETKKTIDGFLMISEVIEIH